ncbi:MAG: DUF4302 domain-containing protein [Muribaculaceae bacterium]|nr:DUF4302 domain-containing protein [Muribaculaceae bacterium]
MKSIKKYLLALLMLSVCAVVTTSCSDEKDIFERSAALRLNDAQKNVIETLTKDGGKWEFQYFASGDEEGVVFVMTFHADGTVDVSTVNTWQTTFATEQSSWEVLTDYGIDLSFISYNSLFHRFSDPTADVASGYNAGEGHLGDYEFKVMKVENDNIILRGKKRNIEMRMRRLAADTDDETYFEELALMQKSLFNSKMPTQLLTLSNGSRYLVSDGATQIMSLLPEGGDPVSQTETRNLIILRDGFKFMEPFKNADGSISVQTFLLAEDGTLVCEEDGESKFTSLELSTLLADPAKKWRMDKTTLGGTFATLQEQITAGCKSALKRNFDYFQFQYDKNRESAPYSLYFKNGTSTGNFYCDITAQGADKIQVKFNGEMDNNASTHLERVPEFQDFMNLLSSGAYTLSSESALLPMTIKVTSDATPSNYFYVVLQ